VSDALKLRTRIAASPHTRAMILFQKLVSQRPFAILSVPRNQNPGISSDVTDCGLGVTLTFTGIVERFTAEVAAGKTPYPSDHGVPSHNVLHRLSVPDFKAFHQYCVEAFKIARRALDAKSISASANAWRELFGDEFPKPPSDDDSGGFTKRTAVSTVGGGRFAYWRRNRVKAFSLDEEL